MLDAMVNGVQQKQVPPSRAWRRAAKHVVQGLDRVLQAPVDSPLEKEPPALLIIGAPRSGTTVFYQTVASHRNTVFINNLLERLPLSGARVARTIPGVEADVKDQHTGSQCAAQKSQTDGSRLYGAASRQE